MPHFSDLNVLSTLAHERRLSGSHAPFSRFECFKHPRTRTPSERSVYVLVISMSYSAVAFGSVLTEQTVYNRISELFTHFAALISFIYKQRQRLLSHSFLR
jgi:hypothetical protein